MILTGKEHSRKVIDDDDKSHCKGWINLRDTYFFSQEQFSRYVGVTEVDAGRELVKLGANIFLIGHHI